MLTGSQAQDVLNLIETEVIDALGSDAWLKVGGTAGVKAIEAKYLPVENRQLWTSILPGIAVTAVNIDQPQETSQAAAYDLVSHVIIEYTDVGGDVIGNVNKVQTAMARLMRWLWTETRGGTRLSGLLGADGGGAMKNRTSTGPLLEPMENQRFLHIGIVECDVVLKVAG